MFKNRKYRILAAIVFIFVWLTVSGCTPKDSVTEVEATSSQQLLDVTTSAGQSGKYSTSRTAESYWLNDTQIMRCFHDHVDGWSNDQMTLGANQCEEFTRPSQLPTDAMLLAINMGTGQKTQSVWEVSDNRLMLCNHTNDWWNGQIDSAESCAEWERPAEVDSRSQLAALNSGQSQKAESFWNNPDGTITQCQHDQVGVGFLWSMLAIGPVETCTTMETPFALPDGNGYELMGVTSDSHRPAETFWQDSDGVLVQCKHEKVGEGFIFLTYHVGPALECDYWRAP